MFSTGTKIIIHVNKQENVIYDMEKISTHRNEPTYVSAAEFGTQKLFKNYYKYI